MKVHPCCSLVSTTATVVKVLVATVLGGVLVNPCVAGFVDVAPHDITGIRSSFPNATSGVLLTFGAVKGIDRTVAHFALDDLPETVLSASLIIPLKNIDPKPPLGDLDVYSFFGDGVVSGDEWSAGSLYKRIQGIAGEGNFGPDVRDYAPLTFSIDITSVIDAGRLGKKDFVSFVFRPGQSSDRYWMAPATGTPSPVIRVSTTIPEPSTLLLVGVWGFWCCCNSYVCRTNSIRTRMK